MIAVTLGLLLISAFLFWITHRIRDRRLIEISKKIPGPTPWPLLGNVLEFGVSLADVVSNAVRLAEVYKDTYRVWVGHHLVVLVSDLSQAEIILSHPKLLVRPWAYNFSKPWIGDGLLVSTGDKWRKHRKLITPAFHFKILEGFVSVFNTNANTLIKQLAPHVGGPEFNVFDHLILYTMEGIVETSLGTKLHVQENSDSDYAVAVRNTFAAIVYRFTRPWLQMDSIFNVTPKGRLQRKSIDVIHNLSYKIIKEKRQSLTKENSTEDDVNDVGARPLVPFLETMIRASDNGTILTDTEIREEIDTILGAGIDSSSAALAFGCWALATNQDVQDRVVLELREVLGDSDRSPTYNELNDFKYLDMVIKEILRLYPAVPAYGREVQEDLDLGKYVVPAGTNVVVVPLLIHRDPRNYPDPMKFNPERFLPENVVGRHPYSYIPFSAGPKKCLGWKYATMVLKATFSGLLRKYRILPGNNPPILEWRISLGAQDGMNIKLELRDK